jgi:predicted O-linked N-acetylglucosamine transferase (SPINDLY family)
VLSWLRRRRDPTTATSADAVRALLEEGFALHRAGRIEAAQEHYVRVLAIAPEHPEGHYLLGLTRQAAQDHARALEHFARTLALAPGHAAAALSAAGSHRALGEWDRALHYYRIAHALAPDDAQILQHYGTALQEAGDAAAAVGLLERAAALAPQAWEVHYDHGNVLRAAGRLAEARNAYERAAALAPQAAPVWNNLGICLQELGDLAGAAAHFERARALAPEDADAENNLGAALQGAGRTEDAIRHFERALALAPGHPHAGANLAQALQEVGLWREAIAAFGRAADTPGRLVRGATVLPVIPQSRAEIDEARERFGREVDRLMAAGLRLERPEIEVGACNFHLAFHGVCDRELQEKIARLYLSACPALAWHAPDLGGPRSGPIRVGFISRFLHQHSIGKTTRGLIAQFTRPDFEVVALHVPPFVDDPMARFIREHADRNVLLPPALPDMREAIAALRLDALFYQDIGMDPATYYLAFSRLAPVQCVSFGFPDTTGIPNVDWWVSSENFEAEGAEAHYSERLWRARDVGTLAYYYFPAGPAAHLGRRELGLPEDRSVYFCPHSPFRLHPDFDEIVARLLERDPRGELFIVEGRQPRWTRQYLDRLRPRLGRSLDRVRVLPLQPHARYLALMAAADAVLDPIYFNGMNNSLDAFAAGVPVVTMPHHYQRGRHTFGMYRRMDWHDCVARDPEDYVAIALRLATDRDFQHAARCEIAARRHVLYEDPQVPREFERFFHETVGR